MSPALLFLAWWPFPRESNESNCRSALCRHYFEGREQQAYYLSSRDIEKWVANTRNWWLYWTTLENRLFQRVTKAKLYLSLSAEFSVSLLTQKKGFFGKNVSNHPLGRYTFSVRSPARCPSNCYRYADFMKFVTKRVIFQSRLLIKKKAIRVTPLKICHFTFFSWILRLLGVATPFKRSSWPASVRDLTLIE